MADPKKVELWNGQAIGTAGVDVEVLYLHPSYVIRPTPDKKGKTGNLRMLELFPTQAGLYGFICRWDERREDLDVDMAEIVEEQLRRVDWMPGYCGHHPKRSPEDGRKCGVHITIPDSSMERVDVFRGFVKFGIVRGVRIKECVTAADVRFKADITPGDSKPAPTE